MYDRALHAKLRAWLVTFHPEAAGELAPLDAGPAFSAVLGELQDLHDSKNRDYAGGRGGYENIAAAKGWGTPPWQYAMQRVSEKLVRLQQFKRTNQMEHESVEDTLKDIANLSIIALILWRETR
jgi:hypothetical protein